MTITSESFNVGSHTWTVPTGVTSIDALIIAGGGGAAAGGGGAGGYRNLTLAVTEGDVWIIAVGAGGLKAPTNIASGNKGNESYIEKGATKYSSAGGGYGITGYSYGSGGNGGSGGGSSLDHYVEGYGNSPATVPSQGSNGGLSAPDGVSWGGGGGISAAGSDAISVVPNTQYIAGNGGDGIYNPILEAYCCGGGSGASNDGSSSRGVAGLGSGPSCYGGGGNGIHYNYFNPGSCSCENGGDGIVVISYGEPSTDRYWVGDSGLWTDTAHWSDTSGGAGGRSVPTNLNDVYIDENSFSSAGQIIKVT